MAFKKIWRLLKLYNLDIIDGLKGRHKKVWDEQMRPLPANSRLITLAEAIKSPANYYCIITHSITDLLDIKPRPEPRIIVLHCTLQGRIEEEKARVPAETIKQTLHHYLQLTGAHAVATSMYKGESWGLTDDIVPFGIDPDDYPPYSGRIACGLRICNTVASKKKILMWDFYEKAFKDLPVKLVGHNPDMPGVTAAKNWQDLKETMRTHRFYIHTADPRLEAGYNMASAEAMAAGMPVLTNQHPTSLIKNGRSGFVSDDPNKLREYARILLQDKDLAAEMGGHARKTIIEQLPIAGFKNAFTKSIEIARRKWQNRLLRTFTPAY